MGVPVCGFGVGSCTCPAGGGQGVLMCGRGGWQCTDLRVRTGWFGREFACKIHTCWSLNAFSRNLESSGSEECGFYTNCRLFPFSCIRAATLGTERGVSLPSLLVH